MSKPTQVKTQNGIIKTQKGALLVKIETMFKKGPPLKRTQIWPELTGAIPKKGNTLGQEVKIKLKNVIKNLWLA